MRSRTGSFLPSRAFSAVLSLLAATGVVVVLAACGSGSASGTSTTDGAVDVATSCPAVAACGGDPTGTWDVVHGCAEQDTAACATGGSGSIKGHFTIQNGTYDLELDTKVTACGTTDSGSDGAGGSATVSGSTITFGGGDNYMFCVQGTTLYLLRSGAKAPKLSVITLRKSAGDGGLDAN